MMKLSPGKKKWLKRLLILALLRVVVGGLLYYVIVYRFKDIVQIAVNKESNGSYTFDASDIEVSLWNKNVVLNNTVLTCKDTLNTSPHYDIKIPVVYLAIQSWKDLVFHRKVVVDSLAIVQPQLLVHDHGGAKAVAKTAAFNPAAIVTNLQKLLTHLQVRSFRLQDGAFTIGKKDNPVPFSGDGVTLTIANFSRQAGNDERLFSADDIDLTLESQHWNLPDGIHDIKFKRLHFSGRKQLFEMDSCVVHAAAVENKGALTFSADKLFFNSRQFAALYEQNSLLIDTLTCYRPVLHMTTTSKKNNKEDSTAAVSQYLSTLFTNVHFNYIEVKDGQLFVINKYRPNYITQKADFKAYNLHIGGDTAATVTTDSIRLNLRKLQFLTTDSLFQLTVAEFAVNKHDVFLKNAVYEPTARNHAAKGFRFTAPALRLKNIRLEALMNKTLMADTAALYNPQITVYNREKTNISTESRPAAKGKNFYQNLHGLGELIAVKHFNIINGSVYYNSTAGAAPLKLTMKRVNADILLNDLFVSDSLIDIKRSLPVFSFRELSVQLRQLKLFINNYVFTGYNSHNQAAQFRLSTAAGATITGKQLYWEMFDWDMFANHKIIQIASLRLRNLAVNTRKVENIVSAKLPAGKDLPEIHIGRLDVDHIGFNSETPGGKLGFEAAAVRLENIGAEKKFLTWNNAAGVFSNVFFNGAGNKNFSVSKINFTTRHETVLQDAKVEVSDDRGYTRIGIPVVQLRSNFHSTNFSTIRLGSILADSAAIDIYTKAAQQDAALAAAAKPRAKPPALFADKLQVKHAVLKYTGENNKDTVFLTAGIGISAAGMNAGGGQLSLFSYEKVNINLAALVLNKGRLSLTMPRSSLTLTNGKAVRNEREKMMLHSGVLFAWQDAGMQLPQTDSTGIVVNNLSGAFNEPSFMVYPKMKLQWQSLAEKFSIYKGAAQYAGKNIIARAGSMAWDPSANKFSLYSFDVLPRLGMQEAFGTPGAWQADYMTMRGARTDISGIAFNQKKGDTSFTVKKIVLDSMSLTTTRDKRMPFRHGIEKQMPSMLIDAIKVSFRVDSVLLQRSSVTVNEIAIKTEKQGTIPLTNINAVITNFTNTGDHTDTLSVFASARLLNYDIRNFHYKEAYGDSLSWFLANVNVSPMELSEFSTVTIPLASVGVDKGNADTLFARWTGNKYAAVGSMDFYYKGLKIKLLDKKDTQKKRLILSLGNWAAAIILRKNNKATSQMFFERDREKFVFNYWVKTILSGITTSAGIKRNRKMLKQYRSLKGIYSLPDYGN